jgi:hypothetical protein
VAAPGVAADLSHIATASKVEGYLPPDDGLKKALTGADIVVIPAGVPRKPGVSLARPMLKTHILMTLTIFCRCHGKTSSNALKSLISY